MQTDIIIQEKPKRMYDAERCKKYYQLNKSKIINQQKYRNIQKISCDCGSQVAIKNICRHYFSLKHLTYAKECN